MLLSDFWNRHPASLQEFMPRNKNVRILTIPKKITGMIQSFDVYGFRV